MSGQLIQSLSQHKGCADRTYTVREPVFHGSTIWDRLKRSSTPLADAGHLADGEVSLHGLFVVWWKRQHCRLAGFVKSVSIMIESAAGLKTEDSDFAVGQYNKFGVL